MTWDLGNTIKWEPIERGITLTAIPLGTKWVPLPTKNYLANSGVLGVGIRNPFAKPHWRLGCFISLSLLVTPDSGSNFVSSMNTGRRIARLGQMSLIQFPDYERYPCVLLVEIPYWHREIYLEIWEYTP